MEWKKHRIAIAAAVFAGLLGLTLWAGGRQDRDHTDIANLPAIEVDANTVSAIEITRPNGETVLLSKETGTWRVAEPLDADADQGNVTSALDRLGDLQITRIVATRPESYERLEVDDAHAVRVRALAGQETVAEVAIGKYANGITMLRVEDRGEVFGASGSLRFAFDRELKAWRNRTVVDVDPQTVRSIRFRNPNGTFEFDRSEAGWSASQGARKLGDFDPSKVDSLVSSAARLTASDFADQSVSAKQAGLEEPEAAVALTVGEGDPPTVLELGGTEEESGQVYLRLAGDPTIHLVSRYLADRLQPGPEAFERVDEPPRAPPPPAPGSTPPGAQGQPQLPPEVMEQLREQMRARQEQQQP